MKYIYSFYQLLELAQFQREFLPNGGKKTMQNITLQSYLFKTFMLSNHFLFLHVSSKMSQHQISPHLLSSSLQLQLSKCNPLFTSIS